MIPVPASERGPARLGGNVDSYNTAYPVLVAPVSA